MVGTPRNVAPIGVTGNAWPGNSNSAGTASAIIDTFSCPFVSAFGHASGAGTITLQGSMEGINFYNVGSQVLSGAGDFAIHVTSAARFHRLLTSATLTLTGTIAAK